MSIIKVKPPGQPIPRVDKRAIETITYSIDLSELLSANELANKVEDISSKLDLVDSKIKHGKTIETKVPASTVDNSQYIDFPVNILFSTNIGNTRAAVFQIRVHK